MKTLMMMLAAALFVLAPLASGCTNQCRLAFNGTCDEDGRFPLCPLGSDSNDCRGDRGNGGDLCTDSCEFAGDGDCDDGGAGSDYSLCDFGTDCTDCGTR